MELLSGIANELDIPLISQSQKVWFFRTKGGKYYYDFQYNNFIALGWDLIPPEFILDAKIGKEAKKARIEHIYPNEKRPGLILGQMNVFYNEMQAGDMVIIPNEGSKEISVGKIGDLVKNVNRQLSNEDYPQCSFQHKRSVEQIKKVDAWQDIYLFKALRAQQTISDVTEEATLVFRNLFPVYICNQELHLTLQKSTEDSLTLVSNLDFLWNMVHIADSTATLYGKESFKDAISIKTAVGSPGFQEIIFPLIPTASISVGIIVFVLKMAIGKAKSPDGSVSTGLLALVDKVNAFLNDHVNRQKIKAETEQIKAKTIAETKMNEAMIDKIKAETQLIQAQTAHKNIDAQRIELEMEQISLLPSGKTTEEQRIEDEQLTIPSREAIEEYIGTVVTAGDRICDAAQKSGLSYDGKKITKVS